MNCLTSIHCYVMQETQQLQQAGLQPCCSAQQQQQEERHRDSTGLSQEPPATPEAVHDQPSTYDILMEKLIRMNKAHSGMQDAQFPYVGPRTYLQFLECFCETFCVKHTESVRDRENLSKAVATLNSTRDQAEEMKNTLRELRQQHDQASKLSDELLKSLTLKSCQLEKLKALMGQSSSVLNAMQMVSEQERQLVENDEDDEELLAVFMDKQTTRLETLLAKARENVTGLQQEEGEARHAMTKSKETALKWHGKIDRNAIDQIKGLNNPPRLVGTIMDLMLTLLKQYGVDTQTSSASEGSSSSTPGHINVAGKKKKASFSTSTTAAVSTETAKLEKEQWNAIQIAIGDSQRFLDLLNGLKWEEGLSTDAVNLILSKLAIPGKNVPASDSKAGGVAAMDRSASANDPTNATSDSHLITISMARHAAESTANMCGFAVSIVEYNESFKPYKIAAERLSQ